MESIYKVGDWVWVKARYASYTLGPPYVDINAMVRLTRNRGFAGNCKNKGCRFACEHGPTELYDVTDESEIIRRATNEEVAIWLLEN